jgi:hypothetical protein
MTSEFQDGPEGSQRLKGGPATLLVDPELMPVVTLGERPAPFGRDVAPQLHITHVAAGFAGFDGLPALRTSCDSAAPAGESRLKKVGKISLNLNPFPTEAIHFGYIILMAC